MSSLLKVSKLPWVLFVDDERELDNSIIVTLKNGYTFKDDPGCGVMGFDTIKELIDGTKKSKIIKN
jgi:hypothetical protein